MTLRTLNILAIWGNIARALDWSDFNPVLANIKSKIDANTTKKSKIFHPK